MNRYIFTIRDVLWLTVVAATLTAWAIDHWRQASEIERLSTGILIGGSS